MSPINFLLWFLLLAGGREATGQSRSFPQSPGTPDRPGWNLLAQDSDWVALRRPDTLLSGWDRLRYIPLNTAGNIHLSFSANLYVEPEGLDNILFGRIPGFDGFLNTRVHVYAGLRFGRRFRLFGGLKHGERLGADFMVAGREREYLDLHVGFAELSFGDLFGGDDGDALLRAGRMELHYGTGRMISAREGPNIRNDYLGVKARGKVDRTVFDLFSVVTTESNIGLFDNRPMPGNRLWGVYASTAIRPDRHVDYYYLGQRNRMASYLTGAVAERRHSFGLRYWTQPTDTPWSVDLETTLQRGKVEGDGQATSIGAWTASAQLDRQLGNGKNAPTLSMTAGISSGDRDSTDAELGTFRASNPPGFYFGMVNAMGPGNLFGYGIALDAPIGNRLLVTPQYLTFWRLSEEDGIFNPGGGLVRPAEGQRAYIGSEINLNASYSINQFFGLDAGIGYFFVGQYLEENPPALDGSRVALKLSFQL